VGDLRLTYAQLDERTNRLANYLLDSGAAVRVEREHLKSWESGQESLGLYLRNGNQYLEGVLGSFKARVAPFNVNYRYVEEELLYLLTDAHATSMMYAAEFAPVMANVRDRLPDLTLLLQVADSSGHPLLEGAIDYEGALASSRPSPPPVEPSPDDLYILYTGGTTGMPKGVLWRQHDIFMAAMGGRPFTGAPAFSSYDQISEGAEKAGTQMRIVLIAPFMHGASQWGAFTTIANGGTSIVLRTVDRVDPVEVWKTVERERVISIPVIGDAVARPLLEELERGSYDTSSLITVGNGGAR
jgi:fatty-acyl-CoA synthase